MFTWKRFLLASATTLLLILAFITLILPGMIIDRASQWAEQETGRNLAIESIRINPFNLSIEVHKLHLSELESADSFVSWDLLNVSLSIESLYHRAPIIDELRLDNPYLHLERLSSDRFNFSDLIPGEKAAKPAEPPGEPSRFSVNNISINGGRIDLIDSSLKEPAHHSIRDLQLSLPSIGNLPQMIENPSQPLFRAVINGSPIDLAGEVKPFSAVLEMRLAVRLDDIDLPFYLGYLPVDLPVELRNGKLNLNLDLLYRFAVETGGELEVSGRVDLASVNIWDKQQEQLFFLPLLQIEIAPSQPLKQEIHLTAVRAYNLEIQLKRDRNGEWNHSRMMPADTGQAPSKEPEQASAPFKLLVDSVEIRDGVVFFEDNFPNDSFKTVARAINIDVKDFALDAKNEMPLMVSLETDRDEIATVKGHFLLAPFALSLQIELDKIQAGAYAPYYHDAYSGPLGGELDVDVSLAINPEQPLLISGGRIVWRDAFMAFNEQEGTGADLIEVSDISFDLGRNRLEVGTARYENGRANFSRSHQGHWSFLSRNFPVLAKLSEVPEPAAPPEAAEQGPVFSYRIGELDIRNWAFDVVDHLPKTPAKFEASDFNLTFKNLAAPEKSESSFAFSTTFQRKGTIEVEGTGSLADLTADLSTSLKRIPFAAIAPYVAEQANLVLVDGYLDARLKSSIDAGSDSMKIVFGGDLGISRFHLLDSLHREDLLKWNSLQIAGIEGQTEPLRLAVESITLSDYFAKVLIDEDARLNLADAFSKPGASEAVAELPTTEAHEAQAETASSAEIQIATVVLQGGRVDFTDRNLPRPFHADMRELGGRIRGLSSDPATHAEVDLRGRLRNQSPLVISGTVNPLAEKLYLDLKLDFNDIELSPLSSYSGTYVGYVIEKGKLNLELEYSLEEGQLKASNKVFLDQFSFGESVASEKAINLPVNLAVALLKDRNGEIHLDIPVTGSLDDPQFSITGVVWTIIKNLLVKAATSPFALLGALVGGGEEDFSNISFEHGSARLSDAEQEKLQHMAQALNERPGLDVEVSGFIDPGNDAEGYRREKLIAQIRRLKYLDLLKEEKLADGTKEEDVIVPAEEYAEYLWQVYSDAEFPKPRTFLGLTKKLPESEMEKLIYTNTEVAPEELADLAQARALTVQDFLIEAGQLTRERIFLMKPDITAPPDQETVYRARVELGALVR